jgi:peptidoglycan/LPS O-acetylase OafA/YrhL
MMTAFLYCKGLFMDKRAASSLLFAIAAGALLWYATAMMAGRREAWDSPLYWTIAYPVALLLSGLLACLHPRRAWLRALALFEAQMLAMWLRNGEIGNLWPLGMLLIAVLALPAMLIATLVAHFAGRNSTQAE